MIKGILLDFYGTLVEEDHLNLNAIAAAIHGSAQEDTTPAEVGKFWYDAFFTLTDTSLGDAFRTQAHISRTSLNDTIARFGATIDADAAFAGQQRYWASPTLYDETEEFLDTMRELGLATCIVSNADRADVDSALASHGIRVDHVITSQDARHYKPHPRIFELALEATGFEPHEVIHVGDSWRSDVLGASEVGIQPVWLNRDGRQRPDTPVEAHEVTRLTDLVPWLLDLVVIPG